MRTPLKACDTPSTMVSGALSTATLLTRKLQNCKCALPSFLGDEDHEFDLIRMVEKGVYLTPTLGCYGAMARPPWDNLLPPDGKIKNREVMKLGLHALKVGSHSAAIPSARQRQELTIRSPMMQVSCCVTAQICSSPSTPCKRVSIPMIRCLS